MTWIVHTGDNLDAMRAMPDNSVDSVCTDPPYGLGTPPDALTMLRAWLDNGAMEVKGRGFMGKEWDAFVPQPATWREVYRVLKPGGHVLAFAGTRTQDLMALSLRIAGFEIRDMLGWLYGSGFPKSADVSKAIDQCQRGGMVREKLLHFAKVRGIDGKWLESHGVASAASFTDWTVGGHVPSNKNWSLVKTALGVTTDEEAAFEREVVGQHAGDMGGLGGERLGQAGGKITAPATEAAKQWSGWGTALKPAIEPITLARKPLDGTVAANVLRWGTGGLNVDGCRVGTDEELQGSTVRDDIRGGAFASGHKQNPGDIPAFRQNPAGRWPANILHDGSPEVLAVFPQAGGGFGVRGSGPTDGRTSYALSGQGQTVGYGDTGSAARFFYSAKTAAWEREIGLQDAPKRTAAELVDRDADTAGMDNPRAGAGRTSSGRANIHPTVKGVDVMRWLVRLITPPGGTVLDPYTGSGTTGMACVLEGFDFIGCELSPEYADIARARIAATEARQGVKVTDGKLAADDTPAAQMRLL